MKPTVRRVERAIRKVDEALEILKELDSPRAVTISAPLCTARAALVRWRDKLAGKSAERAA